MFPVEMRQESCRDFGDWRPESTTVVAVSTEDVGAWRIWWRVFWQWAVGKKEGAPAYGEPPSRDLSPGEPYPARPTSSEPRFGATDPTRATRLRNSAPILPDFELTIFDP
ncbi:hypothetical protein L484_003843 [Morus notabilis]|uniref:Uncharacterized protein n=1 Tax=Morus notabilis TaxID=981085 RepID=W9QPJ0_9ROSA|nr:hypothetical protein L484_003843 [Morus notabilis]